MKHSKKVHSPRSSGGSVPSRASGPVSEYELYLQSPQWRKKRRAAIQRDKYTCQHLVCSSRKRLEVHHLRYPKILGTEPLTWLITLCQAHHAAAHVLPADLDISVADATKLLLKGRPEIVKLPPADKDTMLKRKRKHSKFNPHPNSIAAKRKKKIPALYSRRGR